MRSYFSLTCSRNSPPLTEPEGLLLSSSRQMRPTPPHFISLSSIVIFSHLLVILPRYRFSAVTRPFLPCGLHSSPVPFSFYVIVPMTCGEVYKLLKSSLHSFLPLPYIQIILITYPFSNILNLRSFLFQVSQPYKSAVLAILV